MPFAPVLFAVLRTFLATFFTFFAFFATNSRNELYLAVVDRKTLRLVPETERVIFPIKGDGVKDGAKVAFSGNFHTMPLSANESLITDCECFPANGFKGDQLQARIRWKTPNKLVE